MWVYFTLLAAFMQAVRTAGQKELSKDLDAVSTTFARFLFALPLVWVYLWLVSFHLEIKLEFPKLAFFLPASLAAITQIVGTALVIIAFRFQNFAVATSLVKTEAIFTALMGVLFFNAALSGFGWLSVIIGVVGVLILSKTKLNFSAFLRSPASAFGVGAGLCFALATLWIREASLLLEIDLFLSAAITLAYTVTLQSILMLAYIFSTNPTQLKRLKAHWKLATFVGVTSMLGSVGWFTAASLQTAAYVKALGQVEFFFNLIITYKIFKEQIKTIEYFGMLLIVLSVLMLMVFPQ